MDPNPHTQRLYDGIELVPRLGDRRHGQLCVMSLVALLAGERHGDRPRTACPVIAAYAIKINDALDCATRQRLKPFAPRIMGTNDGRMRERGWLLARVCVNEAVPRLLQDAGAGRAVLARLPTLPRRTAEGFDARAFSDRLAAAARAGGLARGRVGDLRYLLRACSRDCPELVGSAAAVLLIDAAHTARDDRSARWFWNLALDLVDRLCDVGAGDRPPQRALEAAEIAAATRARHSAAYAPAIARLARHLPRPRIPV